MMQQHGEAVSLSPLVRRVVAPNPGPMTGDGTNTYVIGTDDIAVIDPGPSRPGHVDAILAAVGDGRVTHILCTHTHTDHSPAAKELAERTGAKLVGKVTSDDQHQDRTFTPDHDLSHDDIVKGSDWSIRCIYTPGHVDNHFCFLLEEEGFVFAGDHIMNGSTVVIIPPGGDMKDYIASLERLLDYDVRAIAPGHGDVIDDCRAEVTKLVRHRLMREAKVVSGLQELGGSADLDALVKVVYNDVDSSLHPWAKLSMTAHLIKLVKDGRASQVGETWQLI